MIANTIECFSFRAVGVMTLMAFLLLRIDELESRAVMRDEDRQAKRDKTARDFVTVRSIRESVAEPTECVPVTDEILWIRLNLKSPQSGPVGPSLNASTKRPGRGQGSNHKKRTNQKNSNKKKLSLEPNASSPSPYSSSWFYDDTANRKSNVTKRHQKSRQKKIPDTTIQPEVGSISTNPLVSAPPWHCHLTSYWENTPAGTFPSYVKTGECRQTRCMEGLYECVPKHYSVKVLKRIPNACYPLPVHGHNSAFEEAWTFVDHPIVVGCECTRKREVGTHFLKHSTGSATRR